MLLGFETLNLKFRDLKLWKLTILIKLKYNYQNILTTIIVITILVIIIIPMITIMIITRGNLGAPDEVVEYAETAVLSCGSSCGVRCIRSKFPKAETFIEVGGRGFERLKHSPNLGVGFRAYTELRWSCLCLPWIQVLLPDGVRTNGVYIYIYIYTHTHIYIYIYI